MDKKTFKDSTFFEKLKFVLKTDKKKFVDLYYRLLKKKYSDRSYNKQEFNYLLDLDENEKLSKDDFFVMSTLVCPVIEKNDLINIKLFIDLYLKNRIEKTDLTQYDSFDDIENQISIAMLKENEKELEKQIINLYNNDEFLVLMPLTHNASLKYGANTKWCTASKHSPEYFHNYIRDGVLIYLLNKKTGDKIAVYKNIKENTHDSITFWNAKDIRVDSMELNIPLDMIKFCVNKINEYKNNDTTTHSFAKDIIDDAATLKTFTKSTDTLIGMPVGRQHVREGVQQIIQFHPPLRVEEEGMDEVFMEQPRANFEGAAFPTRINF